MASPLSAEAEIGTLDAVDSFISEHHSEETETDEQSKEPWIVCSEVCS